MLRGGIKGKEFINEVANKGYFQGSRQLDQVVDLELYLTKVSVKRKWKLIVGRGKDRQPGILPDEKMVFSLPFPKNAPIKENINDDKHIAFEENDTGADSESFRF